MKIKRTILIATVILIVVIAIPVAVAALQQNQNIHVVKTYIQPIPTPTVTPTLTNPTATPTTDPATVRFSLFFPNGSAYVMSQDNEPSLFGATNLDTNAVPVNVQSSSGAPPAGYVGGAIVVRNDGNVPITLNAALANMQLPADIVLSSTCTTINPAAWGTQLSGWMGYSNLASGSTVGVGQYAYLSVIVIMSSNVQGSSGIIHNHPTFTYNFDVVVTATQA